jgi:hypothetical protein
MKDDEMSGACSMHGRKRRSYRVLVRKLEGKNPLGRSGHGLDSDIK